MNEVSELQKKRAVNIIWNGAQKYDFTPDFKAFDKDGQAELYWNTIIGAVRRHYDYPQIEKVFLSFQQYEDADTYEGLLWLGLENCVYGREVRDRPALRYLRQCYAQRFIDEYKTPDDLQLYDALAYAHYCRVLGREVRMDKYSMKLLDELEFPPEITTEEILARAQTLFQRWFQIRTEERKKEKKSHALPGLKKRKNNKGRFRKFGIGFADHPENIYGGVDASGRADPNVQLTKMSAAELRAFMETKYGKPVYSPNKIAEIERSLCSGNHADCHLHFTKGEPVKGKIQNGFEALQKTREAVQIQKNRDYYQKNLAQNRTSIAKLTAKIQNSVLLHLQPSPVKANAGRLNGSTVWRALLLNDDKVFIKNEQDNMGDLSVDILLDASTSQKRRQEIVSSQGYMIAESLTRCSIPCRVMSFCSMTGYTILRIFRDYNEAKANGKIFEYVSNGCNRDGLAIRAARYLISQERYEHRILIILSDVKPNDVCKIRGKGEELIPYEANAGVTDTAYEVRKARAEGISVICVFTGVDEDIPSAKLVYGRDYARIQSVDQLADTVGTLLQNQIRNI